MKALAEPELVSRELELEELQNYLQDAIKGKGRTVFVSGEAGTGKTRLLNEFLKSAQKKAVTLLRGYCINNTSMPYFPFLQAFNSYKPKTEGTAAEVRAWLTGLKLTEKNVANLSPQVWKDLTFAAVNQALLTEAANNPTILFIDDLHWADSASLSLIHYIARSISNQAILILGTIRSEELTADAEGVDHPLTDLIRSMSREDLFQEIKLHTLAENGVSRIAQSMIGGDLEPNFLRKLTEDSHGNALFVVESIRMLAERGNLIKKENLWYLTVDELETPNKFRDIILRRLGTLKLNQRRVLDIASTIGEKFSVELLSQTANQEVLDVLEMLNVVARSTSLVFCEGDMYRFDHAKSREVIYEEIPPLLKKGYHIRIAQKLEQDRKWDQPPLAELAYHYGQAGNKEKAIMYSLRAGQDALERYSNSEAVKHFCFVLEGLPEDTSQQENRTAAQQGLGEALFAQNHFKEAMKTFEQIAARENGLAKLRAYRWAMDSAFFEGNTKRLLELSREAESLATIDRLEWARVRMNRGRVNLLLGNWQQGFADFSEALRIDEEEYSLEDTARTLVGLGPACSGEGEPIKALGAELRAIAMYEDLQDLRGKMDAYNRAGQNNPGLNEEAKTWFSKAVDIGKTIGDFNRAAEASTSSAGLYEQIGDLDQALAKNIQALDFLRQTDSHWITGLTYNNLVRVYAKKGELKLAHEYLKRLQTIEPVGAAETTVRRIAEAVLLAAANKSSESNQIVVEALKWMKEKRRMIAGGLNNCLWALEKTGETERASHVRAILQQLRDRSLEMVTNAQPQAFLMVSTHAEVGQPVEARIDIVNVSKRIFRLDRIEKLLLPGFKICAGSKENLREGTIDLGNERIPSLSVKTVKFTLQAKEPGKYALAPQLIYQEDEDTEKTLELSQFDIIVKPTIQVQVGNERVSVPILPNRIATGSEELDTLLLGGIPNNYAIVMVGRSSDQKQMFNRFVEQGTTSSEPTLLITTDLSSASRFSQSHTIYLVVCNPKNDALPANPNVFPLKGVENLTEIDIALVKALRNLNPTYTGFKRACIDITSDVLLQHGAVITRKWLSGLLTDLKAKGFTTLASLDPQMHTKEEAQAILSLFDGEVCLYEKESNQEIKKMLKVIKLLSQKYFTDELPLTSSGE